MKNRRIVSALLGAVVTSSVTLSALALPANATNTAPVASNASKTAQTETLVVGSMTPEALQKALAVVKSKNGSVLFDLPVIHGAAVKVPKGTLPQLQSIPGVSASLNTPVKKMGDSWGEDSGVVSAVYPEVVKADKTKLTGKNIGVAVLDTGVTPVAGLAGRVSPGIDLSGENNARKDSFGHGTFVAGIIAGDGAPGKPVGIAPEARIVPVKVAGADGYSDVVRVIMGIGWTIYNKDAENIKVLNISVGTDSTQDWRVDPLNFAVEQAWKSGIVVVTSAGNSGSQKIAKPGDDPYVITVGATDDRTTSSMADDVIAPYSAFGPTAHGFSKPDLVAPGSHIVSLRAPNSTVERLHPGAAVTQDYLKGSGTSFSTPQVAGAAAILLQKNSGLSPDVVKTRLLTSADLASSLPADKIGEGVLDVKAAVASKNNTPANQGLASATLTGSLGLSQGSACIRVGPQSADLCAKGSDIPLAATSSWATSNWATSNWATSNWATSNWATSSWASSNWASSNWATSNWATSSWATSSWASSNWASSNWATSSWS